eukprot:75863_1
MVEFLKVTNAASWVGTTYYPKSATDGFVEGTIISCSRGCTNGRYTLSPYSPNDPEFIFMNPSYTVTTSDQFMFQVSEGCCLHTVEDNQGSGCATIYFLYNVNCEQENDIKHINWDKLQNENNNSAQIPYSSFSMSLNQNTLEMGFDIDLEYVGSSYDENTNQYNLGTTYVIGFDSFGTAGNKISEPGNCENRISESFATGTFDQWWNYSEYPYTTSHLGSNIYLSYPPPSEDWTLSIDAYSCSPINYNGIFSWNDLTQCQDYNGNDLIDVIDDGTSITLSGTLYVNL